MSALMSIAMDTCPGIAARARSHAPAASGHPGDWPDLRRIAGRAPLTQGYRFTQMQRNEIAPLIRRMATWFPDIAVGSASCYTREDFYSSRVHFGEDPGRHVLVMLLKHGDEVVGMFSCERNLESLSMHARIGVVSDLHRGVRFVDTALAFTEAVSRQMGIGLLHGEATLKTPHVQRAFERCGWRLIGITPGYDREMVAPGVVKRVYEAAYAKVLVDASDLLQPDRENMTPNALALFDRLFTDQRDCPASSSPDRANWQ